MADKPDLAQLVKDVQDGTINKDEFNRIVLGGRIPEGPSDKNMVKDQGYGPEGFPYTPRGSILNEPLPPTDPHQLAGAVIGGGLGALAGGPVGGAMGAIGGATAKTNGDVAATAALSSVPFLGKALRAAGFLAPAAEGGSRVLGALKGAAAGTAMGVGGQEVKSLVDNGNPVTPGVLPTGLAALIGGVAGASGARPALTPTSKEQAALDAANAVQQHQAQGQQLAADLTNTENTASKLKYRYDAAKDTHLDAKRELGAAQDRLNAASSSAGQDFLSKQRQFRSQINTQKNVMRDAQTAADDAADELNSHQSDMAGKETNAAKDFLKTQAAQLKDQAVAAQNANTKLQLTNRDASGRFVAASQKPAILANQIVNARNFANAASKTRAGVGVQPPDFAHTPEDLQKLSDLNDAHLSAATEAQAAQRKLDSLTAARDVHAEAAPGKTINDANLLADHDAASQAEQSAYDRMRQGKMGMQAAQTALSDLKAQLKLHELNAPEPPEDKKNVASAVAKLVLSRMGTAGKLASLAIPSGGSAPTTPAAIPPAQADLRQFLLNHLGANANAAQPAVVNTLSPDPQQ